jgi:tRNA(Met) C34 N-acetyltransferase TmcA
MLRGLSQAGRDLTLLGRRDFHAALPWSLAASLKDLDSRLAVVLLNGRDCADLALSAADRRALERIASGTRQSATAEAAVWKSLVAKAAAGELPTRLAALMAWRVQGRSLEEVCRTFSIAGRKALEAQLQALLSER